MALLAPAVVIGAVLGGRALVRRLSKDDASPSRREESRLAPGLPAPDPRLSYNGPFRNVRPDVPYVGDAACAECHAKETKSYRRHPMALTLVPIAQVPSPPLDQEHRNPFESLGRSFRVTQRDGHTIHSDSLHDSGGKPVYTHDLEVQYLIGSGMRGCSYLAERDGTLLQSPITWYPQKKRWDLSPGFSPLMLAGRTLGGECLFCHSNGAHEEARSDKSFRQPIFPNGHGIGCERCHGPAGEHVKNPGLVMTDAGKLDPTIVNPKHLTPALRESICWQCHLEGAIRVLRRGRERYDFRPGMPLEDFLSIFHDAAEASHDHVVNHVEQMVLSRCYKESKREKKLGCVSCHDPHEKPQPEQAVQHYRTACLKCHEKKPCSLPRPERLAQNKDDSCIACHMQRYSAADVAHVTSTNHRIPRKPVPPLPAPPPGEGSGAKGHAEQTPAKRIEAKDLVSFFESHRGRDDPELARDRAVASALLAQEGGRMERPLREDLARAVDRDPGDLEAKALHAMAVFNDGHAHIAVVYFTDILAREKHHERALIGLAKCCEALNRPDDALAARRLLIQLHPLQASYRFQLVNLLLRVQRWEDVVREARAWLVFDPASQPAHLMLREGLLALDRHDEAEAEKRIVQELQGR